MTLGLLIGSAPRLRDGSSLARGRAAATWRALARLAALAVGSTAAFPFCFRPLAAALTPRVGALCARTLLLFGHGSSLLSLMMTSSMAGAYTETCQAYIDGSATPCSGQAHVLRAAFLRYVARVVSARAREGRERVLLASAPAAPGLPRGLAINTPSHREGDRAADRTYSRAGPDRSSCVGTTPCLEPAAAW